MHNFYSSKQTQYRPLDIKRDSHSLYIVNLATLESIELKLIPDDVSEAYSQQIVSQTMYGTYSPMYFYTGGGSKTISFGFKLHEDINNENGSIYDLRDKLKSFGEVRYSVDGTIIPPTVYLELGDQFAGKGYLNTTFNIGGPFRDKRYIMLDVNIVFTFIEEFETEEYNLDIKQTTYIRNEELTIYLGEDEENFESIADLYKDLESNDLQVLKNFAFQKSTSLAYANLSPSMDYLTKRQYEDIGSIEKIPINTLAYQDVETVIDTIAARYYNLWLSYALIIGSQLLPVQGKLSNLNTLKNEMNTLEYIKVRSGVEWEVLDETKAKEDEQRQALIEVIDAQINLLSEMQGATT